MKDKKLLKANFENLKIWQEAHNLMLIVHGIANKLPYKEKERIEQIRRSSSAVCDNIAEGYSSYYYNEKIKGMYTARKEAGETQNHLKSLQSKGYLNKEITETLISRYQGLILGINKWVQYIGNKRDRLGNKKG